MNINNTSEIAHKSNFLNQILPLNDKDQSTTLYIFPAFSVSEDHLKGCRKKLVNIAAALFGLGYSFGQITLDLSDQQKNIQNKYFFWVKQPINLSDNDFNHFIQKICKYFDLNVKCLIKVNKKLANITIYSFDLVKNVNLETTQISETLIPDFWNLFKGEQQKILEIRFSNASEMIAEPQTNFGKLARKLKADQILQELNLISSRS